MTKITANELVKEFLGDVHANFEEDGFRVNKTQRVLTKSKNDFIIELYLTAGFFKDHPPVCSFDLRVSSPAIDEILGSKINTKKNDSPKSIFLYFSPVKPADADRLPFPEGCQVDEYGGFTLNDYDLYTDYADYFYELYKLQYKDLIEQVTNWQSLDQLINREDGELFWTDYREQNYYNNGDEYTVLSYFQRALLVRSLHKPQLLQPIIERCREKLSGLKKFNKSKYNREYAEKILAYFRKAAEQA